jgi:hypothetical protein
MPLDTSERGFEDTVVGVLTDETGGERVADPYAAYRTDAGDVADDFTSSGGYRLRPSSDFSRERLLIPDDVHEFVIATQPETWKRLKQQKVRPVLPSHTPPGLLSSFGRRTLVGEVGRH